MADSPEAINGEFGHAFLSEIMRAAATMTAGEARAIVSSAPGSPALGILNYCDGRWHLIHAPFRHANEGLARLVEIYSALARSRDATVITDPAATLLSASPAWLSIYGYQLADVLGRNPRIINARHHPPSFFQAMWKELVDPKAGSWSGEIVNRRANGELVHVWQTITAIRAPSGALAGYLGVTRDMTSHVELRDRLLRANEELDRLARFKTDLMSIAAHDLRSPLQGILAHVELMEGAAHTGDPVLIRQMAARVKEIGNGMARLVQNVLDLQAAESGRMQIRARRGNLRSVVRSAVDLHRAVAAKKALRVEFEEHGQSVPSYFDATKIDQALGNLIANSVKFTPPGGLVRLSHACVQGGHGIIVDDSGPGIPEADRERVLERHFRTEVGRLAARQAGGDGWGLAIAAEIVRLHGGEIRAGASPQGGCRMELIIPHGYATHHFREVSAALIYDPEETFCLELAERLKKKEIAVFVATEAGEFAALARVEMPNLILIPDGVEAPEIPDLACPDSGETMMKPVIRLVGRAALGALTFRSIEPRLRNELEESADSVL